MREVAVSLVLQGIVLPLGNHGLAIEGFRPETLVEVVVEVLNVGNLFSRERRFFTQFGVCFEDFVECFVAGLLTTKFRPKVSSWKASTSSMDAT